MTNKFDKIIGINEKLLPKIYTAVSKRMSRFLPELLEQQKEGFAKFVRKHTGYQVTPEDIKEVFEKGNNYRPSKLSNNEAIHYLYVRGKIETDIFMVRVMKLEPKQQFSNAVEKYYINGIK